MGFPAGLQSLAHKRVLRRECGRRGPMWPATHSRPHRSAEQSKDWTPDLLSHPAVPPPRRPSNSAGVGRGTEGETPVAQHPHLHAQHLWVPAPTCPPARHRPDISTSRHSPPASPGLALQPDTLLFCIVMLGGASFIISVPLLSGRGRERGGGSWGWKEESANQPLRGFG